MRERGAERRRSPIDLEAQEIRGPDGGVISFDIDPFRKHCLLEGLDGVGLTLKKEAEIATFEKKLEAEAALALTIPRPLSEEEA